MNFRIILIFTLGCLFSCLLIASCEESLSQISVNGRERRDTRRQRDDSNESDDRDDDDDTRKEYKRRYTIQKLLKLLKKSLSRRQLKKVVRKLRTLKRSNKRITMAVIRNTIKDVVGKKGKKTGAKATVAPPKLTKPPPTPKPQPAKKPEKKILSTTQGQLVPVQKTPKAPQVVNTPQQPEPPKLVIKPTAPQIVEAPKQQKPPKQVKPVVYQPPVQKAAPTTIFTPYIPPPKSEPPVIKMKINRPKPPITTQKKGDVQVIPVLNAGNVPLDTNITPELKLNIHRIPAQRRQEALYNRLLVLRERVNNLKKSRNGNFRKLRERKISPIPEIVAVSLSGPGSSTSAKVASDQAQTVVSAVASVPVTNTKPFKLSSPSHNQNKHYLTPDKTKSVLRTQNHEAAPITTKSSNLSSPPRLTSPTSAEKTKEDFKRVKKIIWVIHSLLSRSKGRKYRVSVKAMKLLRKMARKYKNVMLKKPIVQKPHVATVVHTGPVDQVGTKSLQSNIPLSNTAEMANPHMMENDIIKQKITKKSNKNRFSPSMLENAKDTYISDSPQAKSHSKAIPKSSSIQGTSSAKKSEQTVVEKTESVPALPIPTTLNLKTEIEIPSKLNKDIPKPNNNDIETSNVNTEILKKEINNPPIKSNDAPSTVVKSHDVEFQQKLASNKENDSPSNKIESVISDAPDHLYATFLPPAIENPSLKETKPEMKVEKIAETNNVQNVESVPRDNTVAKAIPIPLQMLSTDSEKSRSDIIPSTDATKFSSLPNIQDPTTNNPQVHTIEESHAQLPTDKTNSVSQTVTPTTIETGLGHGMPDETILVPNTPRKFEAVEQFTQNNIVDATLDQSPYKTVQPDHISDNTQVNTLSKQQHSLTPDSISKPNITPLFQQETKNTFLKNADLNEGLGDTIAIENNPIRIVKQNQAPNTEETAHVTPPVLDAQSVQNKLEGIAVIIPDVTAQTPQQETKVNTHNLNAKPTNIVDIESSFNNRNINNIVTKDEPTLELPPLTLHNPNQPNAATTKPINMHSVNQPIAAQVQPIDSHSINQPITAKVQPIGSHSVNQPIAAKVQSTGSQTVNQPIITKVQPINSHSVNQPTITKAQSIKSLSVNKPTITKAQSIGSHTVSQQSNFSKQKVNAPRKSEQKFQISRTNVASQTSRVGNKRTVIPERNEKPRVDMTRWGRTGLDKAAILKHLLEIKTMREQLVKRMREQLARTGKVGERRLSDLLPKTIPQFLNTRTPSRPKQSVSISQNTQVFSVDSANPSLSNPQGTTRAHRRKRSLLSAHHIPGSIIPHSKNEIFVDMPLRSLSYDKKKNNRVDLYGGLGAISRMPPHVGHGMNDLTSAGSLSMGFVHPNLIQHHQGMTKLERFFRKPVNFIPEPQIPNIANVMNQIFAPGPPIQRPQLFAGNSLSASVSSNNHHKPFHLNASVRKPSYAAKKRLSGLPKRRNFVEAAPVKLRTSNRHGVRISVNKDASPGSYSHQQNLQRIKNERTSATTHMDNSLSLGPPKSERPIYRTVRRIVILPLPTPKATVPTVHGNKQNRDIVHKSSQLHYKEPNNQMQHPQTGYLTKAQPETKSFEDTNKIEYKTKALDSNKDAIKAEYAGNNLSMSPTKIHQNRKNEYSKHQLQQNKLSVPPQKYQLDKVEKPKSKHKEIKSPSNSSHHDNSGTHDSASRYSGNSLSLSPPRHSHMRDTTPFVNFAFSLNSPASMFMNKAQARKSKVLTRDYSGSISAAPNSIARAKARNDKAGPGLSATPFVSQKSSNAGIFFEEIDPLSLTNFIMAASNDLTNGGSDIKMSTGPVKLTGNSIMNGRVLEIPEKKDFIGKKTQKEKKNGAVNVQSLKQNKNTSKNEMKKGMPHRFISVRPLSDLTIPKDNTNISPPHSRHSSAPSEHSRRRSPFSFSLSGISSKSHTHSPKTTVPHSVKPTIKPTLEVPMKQQEIIKSSAQRASSRLAQMQQNALIKKETGKNSLSNYQFVENSLSKHQPMKDFLTRHTTHQPKDNSRTQYQTVQNYFTRPPLKPTMEKKFTKYPSRDYVPQTSSLNSITPMHASKTYPNVEQGFDFSVNSKYSTTAHVSHSTIAQSPNTTPSSQIITYKPTTPSWRQRYPYDHQHHHASGQIGHYKKQSTIEIQRNRIPNNNNQIPPVPTQIHGSSLSNRKLSSYTMEHYNQFPKQSVSHPASRTSSNIMENIINKSKPKDAYRTPHSMDNTISHTKQWAANDLSTSKTHNPKQIIKPAKLHGYAIHTPKVSTAKQTQSITRPPAHSNSQAGQKSTQSLTSYNIQSPFFIIENSGTTKSQFGWTTPSPKHTNSQSMIKTNHQEPKSHNMVYSIYNKPNSQIRKAQQHVHSHTTHNNIQQQPNHQHSSHHSARHNAANTAHQPTQVNANMRYQKNSQSHSSVIVSHQISQNTPFQSDQKQLIPVVTQRPTTMKYHPQTTVDVTPISITPQTPATTKVPVFSAGAENYAISSKLLALLRQLPVGDLPDHKKRRLERILGVQNGQLEDNNAEHPERLKNDKFNHLEVSP